MSRFLLACAFTFFTGLTSFAQRGCSSYDYLQQELKINPGLAKKLADIQSTTTHNTSREYLLPGASQPVIVIPVVVHILYNNAGQNISDAQVYSQIEALNKDFRKLNDDTANVLKSLFSAS